jgi:quinol monooxygenase YgiN
VSVNVVVNFQASDGNAESLLPLLREGRDLSRKADGCEAFDLFRRQDDPDKFMFMERWTSIDAHHANMAVNIVASGHLAKILPLLIGPPDNSVIETV